MGFHGSRAKYNAKIGYSGPTGSYMVSAKYDNRSIASSGYGAGSVFGGSVIGKKHITAEKVRALYQKRGAVHISESYGSVSDLDLVAVGHQTWQTDGVARVIYAAIVRKLLQKAGIDVDTAVTEIPFSSPNLSNAFKMIIETRTDVGNISYITQYFNDDASIHNTFDKASGLGQVIWDQIRDSNAVRLQRVYLYEFNFIGDNEQSRINSQLNMKEEKMSLTVSVMTTMQNRTLSTTGASTTDVNNAQPVKGPAFEFSGNPKSKQTDLQPLNTVYDEGVILYRRGQTGTDGWSEPPIRGSFSNVVKGSYVRLPVGQLKNMAISKTWTGTYEKVMSGWRFTSEGADKNSIVPGVSQVCFFEEEINSGSSNKITIGYESQHTLGCVFTTSRKSNMQPDYLAYEVSNNAA